MAGVRCAGDAELRAAGELLEALQQGAARQDRHREGAVDRFVAESAAESADEAVPGQHLGQRRGHQQSQLPSHRQRIHQRAVSRRLFQRRGHVKKSPPPR